MSAVIMGEVDMLIFLNNTETSKLKKRVEPSIAPTDIGGIDDVTIKVNSDISEVESKQPLASKDIKKDTRSYADVLRGSNSKQ